MYSVRNYCDGTAQKETNDDAMLICNLAFCFKRSGLEFSTDMGSKWP